MKKFLIAHFICLICTLTLGAQVNQFTTAGENDPAAKEILRKVKEKFERNKSFMASFELLMKFPGMEDQKEKGTIYQQNEEFVLDMDSYQIISNDDLKWVYLKAANEVNIYNASGSEDWVTPKDFLQVYDSEDFVYVLLPEAANEDKSVHFIEFKPLDRSSEYVKIRMALDKKDNQIKTVIAFSRDGSSYELRISSIDFNPKGDPPLFIFDPSKYPGVKIEDLRID